MSQTPWVLDPNPLHQQQAKQLVSDLVDFTQDDPSDPTVLSQVQSMPVAVCNQFYFHVLDSKHNMTMDPSGFASSNLASTSCDCFSMASNSFKSDCFSSSHKHIF